MTDGIFLSTTTFNSLDVQVQGVLLKALGLTAFEAVPAGPDTSSLEAVIADAEGVDEIAVLSDRQARKLVEGVHEKTRAVLEALADLGPDVSFEGLLNQVGLKKDEWRALTGVWSGLTKRVRTVSGDKEAELLAWRGRTPGNLSTHCTLHPVTHQALRKALGR